MSFIDRILEAEYEAERPAWAAFWQAYRPLTPPPPPRRPTPSEVEAYLRDNATAVPCRCPTPCSTCRCRPPIDLHPERVATQ